jgi:hypothetical protein
VATGGAEGWSLITIQTDIPPDMLKEALDHPSAIRVAYDMGILEFLGISLTVLGVVIALAALLGGWLIRREAIAAAKVAAQEQIPNEVKEYLKIHIHDIMRSCLKDPELASSIQASIMRFGLRDAPEAFDVDTDAIHKETTDDGHNG